MVLVAIGSGAGAVGGCVSRGYPNRSDAITPGDDDGSSLGDVSIETVDAQCAGPDFESVTVGREDDHIRIDGNRLAPTPCYSAVLDSAEIDESVLSVTIDIESALEADEECIQCVGGLEYEAIVELTDPNAIDEIRVTHVDGGVHTITIDEVNEGPDDGGDGHLASPEDEINAHLYNDYEDELAVDVEIASETGDVVLSESVRIDAASSTGLGTVDVVFVEYTVDVDIDEIDIHEHATVDADARGTIEIRIGEDGTVEIVFLPID